MFQIETTLFYGSNRVQKFLFIRSTSQPELRQSFIEPHHTTIPSRICCASQQQLPIQESFIATHSNRISRSLQMAKTAGNSEKTDVPHLCFACNHQTHCQSPVKQRCNIKVSTQSEPALPRYDLSSMACLRPKGTYH